MWGLGSKFKILTPLKPETRCHVCLTYFFIFPPEYLCQFNPFYYYYTAEHASRALDRQLEIRRKAAKRQLCAPPKLSQLADSFRGLTKVAASPAVMKAIWCTLERSDTILFLIFSAKML